MSTDFNEVKTLLEVISLSAICGPHYHWASQAAQEELLPIQKAYEKAVAEAKAKAEAEAKAAAEKAALEAAKPAAEPVPVPVATQENTFVEGFRR